VSQQWQDLSEPLDGIALFHESRPGDVPLLMVHGIGPGTTGRGNFGPLLERLSPRFAPHVIDLAGFGASDRKTAPPFFDVPFWLRQIELTIARVRGMHGIPPVLIGNSVAGALVLKTVARNPDISRVVAIGAPSVPEVSDTLRGFWQAPADAASLAAAMRPMTARMSEPPPALVQARFKVFAGDYPAYFSAMLAEPETCLARAVLAPDEAFAIRAHVTLVHGRDDRACGVSPVLSTLLPMLPNADLIVLGGCGHNVLFERCDDVLAILQKFEKDVLF
jgi:pimeloyl-ACP methyl ester carboxylesterase